MSYSFTFSGDENEVGRAFDTERDKAAGYGMLEAEQRDIDEARDFAMVIANQHGPITGSCSGHWNLAYKGDGTQSGTVTPDPEASKFGRITVTIERKAEA